MSIELKQRPMNDWIFKRIFGDKRYIHHLKGFLSALLSFDKDELTEVVIQNPFTAQDTPDDKFGILDVSVTTASGNQVNLEVQVSPQPDLGDRLVFYVSNLAARQEIAGKPYGEMAQSISICILDHVMSDDIDDYHLIYRLHDIAHGKCLSDKIEVHILELPKLPEKDSDPLWSWLSYFKSRTEEDLEVAAAQSKEVELVVTTFKKLTADQLEMQRLYDYEKKQRDIASERWHALHNAAVETAKRLLIMGISPEQVAKGTELDLKEVNKLAQEL